MYPLYEVPCIHQEAALLSGRLETSDSFYGKPIAELRSVTCHMGSQCYLPSDTGELAPS